MSELELRPVTADEFPAFERTTGMAFSYPVTDAEIERDRKCFEPDRSLAVFDNGRMVATAGAFSFELTLPGLTSIPVAGVSYVGVLATHRRRGTLRRMMRHQLDDVLARGESVAVLTASESVIYGRFGYGLATSMVDFEIETDHSAFLRPVDDAGRLVLIDTAEAAKVLPDLHERCRRAQPGDNSRSEAMWHQWFADLDLEHDREGATALFYVLHETAAGEPDGYALYRVKHGDDGLANSQVRVDSMRGLEPATETALWRYLLDIDLISSLRASGRAVDDQLQWMLRDPRRVRATGVWDMLWCRLVDLPAALSARRYSADGELVLDVVDEFCPWNAGRFRLTGGPDGATCEPAPSLSPDLALSATELGAAYLGGVKLSTLARAGRVVELTGGALRRADAMFASERAPWTTTPF